jgi:hypothetical protein
MVEIRVAVEDTTRVPQLMWRLATPFDRSAISFDRLHGEVLVGAEQESRAAIRVVEIVQAWMKDADVESATLSVGECRYTLTTLAPLAAGS